MSPTVHLENYTKQLPSKFLILFKRKKKREEKLVISQVHFTLQFFFRLSVGFWIDKS